MAKFINLTPHRIDEALTGASFETSGEVARVATSLDKVGTEEGIPLFRATYGQVEGLPEPVPGTIYIVSGLVLAALNGSRSDVVAPGDLVRDEAGQPVGCKGFKIG